MAYVPRKRTYKIRWKFAAPLLLLMILVLYAVVSVLLPSSKDEKQKFTVCSLNEKETVKLLDKTYAETYQISDYTYYGESLGLYTNAYTVDNDDELAGKTLQLHNLCTDKAVTMTIDTDVDQKITLNDLDPGFYELTVIDNLVEKRLVYKDTLHSETFDTIKRSGSIKQAELIADKHLLKDYDLTYDNNYLFLNIKKAKPDVKKIDVFIDPYGMSTDFQYVPDEGSTGNGLKEYKEMYDAAVIMKKQLESYGLRVEISRDSAEEQADKAYGKEGRLARAYDLNARYYIMLRMNQSEMSLSGAEIWHSSYSSSVLGKYVMFGLQKNLDMKTSTYVNQDGSGVGPSAIDKKYFDNNIYLRETGGRVTFAAMYSDLSKEENAVFKDADGMNALEIDFGYVTSSDDAAFWKANKEKIAKQTADSFAEAVGVKKAD